MRILFVSDAWHPQVNGVVRTIEATAAELTRRGHTVEVIGPEPFRTLPLPTYPEIRIAMFPRRKLDRLIRAFRPDTVHIATEGPLGWAARRWCVRGGMAFTTAYHTRFPEYVARRFPLPKLVAYAALRRFHAPAAAMMVATDSLKVELQAHGFHDVVKWTRGVDTQAFRPLHGGLPEIAGPILLYAGRIAVEKNLPAFLDLPLPGTKVVVGDGPQLAELKQTYPRVHFTGALQGEQLAAAYSRADAFVFPSRTDTFGLVLAESLACGVPVAAFLVPGPADVLAPQDPGAPVGFLDKDLKTAIERCLAARVPPARCRAFAEEHYSWGMATDQFLDTVTAICDDVHAHDLRDPYPTGRPAPAPASQP